MFPDIFFYPCIFLFFLFLFLYLINCIILHHITLYFIIFYHILLYLIIFLLHFIIFHYILLYFIIFYDFFVLFYFIFLFYFHFLRYLSSLMGAKGVQHSACRENHHRHLDLRHTLLESVAGPDTDHHLRGRSQRRQDDHPRHGALQLSAEPRQVCLLFPDGPLPVLRDAPAGIHCAVRPDRRRPAQESALWRAEKLPGCAALVRVRETADGHRRVQRRPCGPGSDHHGEREHYAEIPAIAVWKG